jgi:hypothetical protein
MAGCAVLAAVPAAGASGVPACGHIHASVPYTANGHADRWAVYVEGSASCASAIKVLDAVTHLHARAHTGSSEADSYFTYAGWLCPFGLMGEQSCELPTRLPAHPPIRAHTLAINCTTAPDGCPVRLPSSDI